MDWKLLIPTTVATLAAVIGWVVAHKLNAARDVRNKQREIRLKYLSEAYDVFIEIGRNVDILGNYREVERAISYIHLYGNTKQVELCDKFVNDIALSGSANHTELVVEVRNFIRSELGLRVLSTKLNLLKVTPKEK